MPYILFGLASEYTVIRYPHGSEISKHPPQGIKFVRHHKDATKRLYAMGWAAASS